MPRSLIYVNARRAELMLIARLWQRVRAATAKHVRRQMLGLNVNGCSVSSLNSQANRRRPAVAMPSGKDPAQIQNEPWQNSLIGDAVRFTEDDRRFD